MRNLLDFFVKYAYFILFILLEAFCLVLFFSANPFQRASFSSSANVVTGSINEQWSDVVKYMSLASENEALKQENADLRNRLEAYRRNNIPVLGKKGFEYIAGSVISATTNREQNFITINVGENMGIENGMGVIGQDGVVGIICSTSEKYSTVMPIINPDSRISVKLSENGYFGSLSWDGKDVRTAQFTEVPGYVEVKVGDEVVTSGFSSIFPEGIVVGYVKSYEKDLSTDFYLIEVELSTNFHNLKYVYGIRNNNKDEIEQSEKKEKSTKK
ncbi:MAG: rod shape-determining protein MreC [Bacteroidales bacterium]|nr:rod shape-determining protein MreC [Bacteroidales bacterium]